MPALPACAQSRAWALERLPENFRRRSIGILPARPAAYFCGWPATKAKDYVNLKSTHTISMAGELKCIRS